MNLSYAFALERSRVRLAAENEVERAIARADLVARVARLRRELVAIRLQRDDDVTDAQLRLGVAQLALEGFDRTHRV